MQEDPLRILRQELRRTSVSRINYHSSKNNFEVVELGAPSLVPGHWMSLIFAGGAEVRVTFKVFFFSADVEILSSKTFGSSLTVLQVQSFLKEFCNLVIGRLKDFMAFNRIIVGASLPLTCRGFDDLHFPRSVGSRGTLDFWALRSPDVNLECHAIYEIFENVSISQEMADTFAESPVEFF